MHKTSLILVLSLLTLSCAHEPPAVALMGRFHTDNDLLLAHFDCKTDVDDLYSVAGVATMFADPRFKGVRYHAVAGAYGIQKGDYVPADELFEAAFGSDWSDAHSDFERALNEVTRIAIKTLEKEGDIWIAEAGQSDFSAALVRKIKTALPKIETSSRINVVQHSNWNENHTAPDNLSYVKENTSYHKIPDGNATGNGSPGLVSREPVNWKNYVTDPEIKHIWTMAIETASRYNGQGDRYNNPAIASGGMDFSDVSETCWIFGFEDLANIEAFFKEFSASPGR